MLRTFATVTAAAVLVAAAIPSLAQQPSPSRPTAPLPSQPSQGPGPTMPAVPTPNASASPEPGASTAASSVPSAAPNGAPPSAPGAEHEPANLLRFTGQLLDVRSGYVYYSTGDAFKLAASSVVDDYDTGKPLTASPAAKMFARAIFDPATKQVVRLDVTRRRLPQDSAFAPVAQEMTATKAVVERAPEIVGVPVTGKEVAVAFVVTVPATTPLNANVYISTDASGWNPQAIKMDRIDARRYRAVRRFASGTKFAFRVTRGDWNTVELGPDGLQAPPHQYFTKEVDAQEAVVTVYSWTDNRTGSPSIAQPGAVPTPYNPNPFPPGLYPHGGPTPTYPLPTQRPLNPFPNVPH